MIKRSVALLALISSSLFSGGVAAQCAAPGHGHLAIIIDDLGYNLSRGTQIAELPADITLSIIPATPHGRRLSELGLRRGKEIMVHMPMTAISTEVTDPLFLSEHQDEAAMDEVIATALADIPGATGVNNHMGSRLTVDRPAMTTLMRNLKRRGLFFVDSRTTAATVAEDVANTLRLPTASRSVFLDNSRDATAIADKFLEALQLAREHGKAIAIGHPYPETLSVLSEALSVLPPDVTITRASNIVSCNGAQRLTSMP